MSHHAETIKVCVRIPKNKKEDLLAFASELRANSRSDKAPGWDSKKIHKISESRYNGLDELYRFQNWPEKGNSMMANLHSYVKEDFGSIVNFVEIHSEPFDGKTFRATDPTTDERS